MLIGLVRSLGHAFGIKSRVSCHSDGSLSHDLTSHSSLTIASFNVEWLFDGVDDDSGVVAGPYNPHAMEGGAGVARRTHGVAEVLKRLQADIVNFVEVENCDVLQRVAGAALVFLCADATNVLCYCAYWQVQYG